MVIIDLSQVKTGLHHICPQCGGACEHHDLASFTNGFGEVVECTDCGQTYEVFQGDLQEVNL